MKWSHEDTKIIEIIIELIQNKIVLNYPNYLMPFELKTDSSNNSIRAVLLHKDKIIGIYSKKLLKRQQNYTIYGKECYAIISSLSYFKNIIFGCKVNIETDNWNLLFDKIILNSRVQRWKLLLEEQNVKLAYIPGNRNIAADFHHGILQ